MGLKRSFPSPNCLLNGISSSYVHYLSIEKDANLSTFALLHLVVFATRRFCRSQISALTRPVCPFLSHSFLRSKTWPRRESRRTILTVNPRETQDPEARTEAAMLSQRRPPRSGTTPRLSSCWCFSCLVSLRWCFRWDILWSIFFYLSGFAVALTSFSVQGNPTNFMHFHGQN